MDPLRGRIGQIAVQNGDGQSPHGGQLPFFGQADPQTLHQLYAAQAAQYGAGTPYLNPVYAAALQQGNIQYSPLALQFQQQLPLHSLDQRFLLPQQQNFNQPQFQFQTPPTINTPPPQQLQQQQTGGNGDIQPTQFVGTKGPQSAPVIEATPRTNPFGDGSLWIRRDFVANSQQTAVTFNAYGDVKMRAAVQQLNDPFANFYIPTEVDSNAHKAKRVKTEKESKATIPVQPESPMEKLRMEAARTLAEDSMDFSDRVMKYNELLQSTENITMRLALLEVLDLQPDEMVAMIGKLRFVPMTLQRWLVKTYNDNKQNTDVDADISKLIAAVFRVLFRMDIKGADLKKYKLDKVSTTYSKKWQVESTRKLAASLLEKGSKLDGDSATPEPERQDSLKRKSVEPDTNAAKRVASGPGPDSKQPPVPSTSTQTTSTVSSAGPSDSSTNGGAKKPVAFFKALGTVKPTPAKSQPARPAAQAQPSKTTPAPSSSSTFSSIFDQLRERQKKDEEAKTKKAEPGKQEVAGRKKQKKSVSWRPEAELVEIKEFEVLEPEGDYYGGGTGEMHEWENARDLDVAEGRDAREALRNRNLLDEEEEDLMEWYKPIPIDTEQMYAGDDGICIRHAFKRLGTVLADAPDAKVQAAREASILAVQYFSEREIPFSPKEPVDDGSDNIDPNKPIIMQLAADATPVSTAPPAAAPVPDLSAILAQIGGQPASAPAPAAPENPAAAILQSLQALAPQPQQQASAADTNPLASILGLIANQTAAPAAPTQPVPTPDLSAVLQALTQPQQQQPAAANPIGNLLASLTGGQIGVPQNNTVWDDQNRNGRDIRKELQERTGWTEQEPNFRSGGKKWKKAHKEKKYHDPKKKYTKACTYYMQNRCTKGDECPFLHTDV